MSNALLKLCNQLEGLPAPARQVLHVLADDARDYLVNCSFLTTAKIAQRTGLSRRTIHRAYVVLIEAGHITRLATEPGAGIKTKVHPIVGSTAPDVDLAEGPDTMAEGSATVAGGPIYIESTITHSTNAGARERESAIEGSGERVSDSAPATLPDPADQVFDEWDRVAAAKGLPGPVRRDVERRQAIERRIAAEKLWRVLAAVRAVGDAPYLTARKARHAGQGDVMADFDFVFGVGHLRGNRVFERLLEGSFTGGRAIPAEEPRAMSRFATTSEAGKSDRRRGHEAETEDIRRLRARLRDEIGSDHLIGAWIDPLRFEWRDDELLAIAPSGFHADWITGHFVDALRRAAGGKPVRVTMREKVSG